jgi:hypothetical protein
LGHPPACVWGYTPRQAFAFLKLAQARREQEAAAQLGIAALAARGDGDEIGKQIREWSR